MRFLQFCGLILLGGLVSCSWQSAPTPPPVEPQPLSPVAQFMVANATGATAVIEDETFGGEVRVTLEDAFLSAAGETCKRATLDRKSTRLNSSHGKLSRMPSSA